MTDTTGGFNPLSEIDEEEYLRKAEEEAEMGIREAALKHVTNLYKANALKNTHPSKDYIDMDKSTGDLIQDARFLAQFIKGEI